MREQTERRQPKQQDAQFRTHRLTDARECRCENGQHQQMMHDGGGGPCGDPDVGRAHPLEEFLSGIEPGKDALRLAGSGLRARGGPAAAPTAAASGSERC